VGDFKSFKKSVLRQNIFEQFSQGGDIPLTVPELVYHFALSVTRLDLEHLVERFVRRHHTQIFIEK
jgi:hypothetical protein